MNKNNLTRQGPDGWAQVSQHMGLGLVGLTLGSLGIGNIGAEVYRMAKPFEMRSLPAGVPQLHPLRLLATNPDQEQAEEEMEVAYDGEPLEIGFNVSYLIDALVNLPSANAHLFMTDSSSSCLIRGDEAGLCEYVVMPMRL